MTKQGSLYVGRLGVYERGEQNILFAIRELKNSNQMPTTSSNMVGHSNGGDISMFLRSSTPTSCNEFVTLDNFEFRF